MNQNNKNSSPEAAAEAFPTAVRWLSEGLEELLLEDSTRSEQQKPEIAFDIVIVGSGYGGALAAAELAGGIDLATGKAARVCVLERGREYLAGMFPGSEAELPGALTINARNSPDPYGSTDGVIDLRIGKDVTVLQASGLGGGSLINAGVMEKAEPWVFKQPCWPGNLRKTAALDRWYDAARRELAPNRHGKFNHALPTKKQDALFRLYPKDQRTRTRLELQEPRSIDSYIPIAPTVNGADVPLEACKRCGDCMTGCNQRAKNSLDQNSLVKARRCHARIICGATVVRLKQAKSPQGDDCWDLEIAHTDPLLRRKQDELFRLRARRVILAAGSLGTTEILMRSRKSGLALSSQLGERFSANGDIIAASYDEKHKVNAVATETQEFDQRDIGPTTGGMFRAGTGEKQIVIQEFAIPGPIRRLFEEGFTTSKLFHRLASGDPDFFHWSGKKGNDPYGVHADAIARTQAIGVMGHDGAQGRLVLKRRRNKDPDRVRPWLPIYDQGIEVRWPDLKKAGGLFDTHMSTLKELIEKSRTGGTLLTNPFWQLLPENLTTLLDMPRGPALTTHPLGGCSMADTWRDGVVDEYGRVFDRVTASSVHPGLVVLDGSFIPCSLGINPAFTISALVLRALEKLKSEWQRGSAGVPEREVLPMPSFKTPRPAEDIPTKVAILERMVGGLHLTSDPSEEAEYTLELTLRFEPVEARELARNMERVLKVSGESVVRVFRSDVLREMRDRGESEMRCDQEAAFIGRLGGEVRLFDRGFSTKPGRVLRGALAWYRNRGKRDTWNKLVKFVSGTSRKSEGTGVWDYICQLWNVATQAGEIRLFEYELEVLDEKKPPPKHDPVLERARGPRLNPGSMKLPTGTRISGKKRFTYAHASNPWTQMLEMELTRFPRLCGGTPTILKLEPKFFARDRKHLFELAVERDGATGLMDLFSFLAYTFRLVAAVHVWSFRKPDPPSSEPPKRLPGELPGVRPPIITYLDVGKPTDGKKVQIRLTRYRDVGATKPVLLIHGFSASGTTFAHPALRSGLAQYLYDAKRDVWVVDLRTSVGLRTSRRAWNFEQVAREDIPEALEYVLRETGVEKIDVVAHCMGAAMFSMALLDPERLKIPENPGFEEKINSLVLSQVGPMVSFTPENIFRAYAVSYIQQIFRESNFEFRPKPGAASEFLDRLFASIPYPKDEFAFENPSQPCARTPYSATRHRMDAWFGRVFNVANMDPGMLERIDDFFGAINMRTSFQIIHFARLSMITTRRGRNAFVIPEQLQHLDKFPVFSIHGAKNGLADPATLVRMQVMMEEMGIRFRKWLVPDFGHQDCMMGRDAANVVFPEILKFLDELHSYKSPEERAAPVIAAELPGSIAIVSPEVLASAFARLLPTVPRKVTAQPPFMGPLIAMPDGAQQAWIGFAANPKYMLPTDAITIEADEIDEDWRASVLKKLGNKEQPWIRFDLTDKKLPYKSEYTAADTPQWYRIPLDIPSGPKRRKLVVLLVYNMPAIIPGPPWTDLAGAFGGSGKAGKTGSDLIVFGKPGWPVPSEIEKHEAIALALERLLCTTGLEDLHPAHVELPARRDEKVPSVRFAVASCQYPAGPLDPGLAASSYRRLMDMVAAPGVDKPLRCLMLVGDQIYADATAGVFDPTQLDDRFELPYEGWLQTDEVRHTLRHLPLLAMLDDHEIDNNWEPDIPQRGKAMDFHSMGLKAYFRVQRAAGPPIPPIPKNEKFPPRWYATDIDGFDCFFADTRSEREKRTPANLGEKQIMNDGQRKALYKWLEEGSGDAPRFVISGSILLPRRKITSCGAASALNSDAWDGYPKSHQELLGFIANRGLRNLVFLSGDEHHSCVATVRLTPLGADPSKNGTSMVLHSVHSSALNAPFPFANGEPADLAGTEQFCFDNPEVAAYPWPRIRCEVATYFVSRRGDGFAVLECTRATAKTPWRIDCEFSRPGYLEPERYTFEAG